MRLFLAVDLPDKVKKDLDNQLNDIKKEYPQFIWVSAENFHLTIHFFGETLEVKRVKERIRDIIWDQPRFYLYSFKLDAFVTQKLMVFLTFRRAKGIEELAEKIKFNFKTNSVNIRNFVPHLTLARGRKSSKQQYFALKNRLDKINIDISFEVKEVVLFESILTGKRPIYKKVTSFKLLPN